MNAPEPPEATLKLDARQVEWRTFGDEIVLLDLRTSQYVSTNEAATVLWRLLEQGTTRSIMIETLAETYSIPAETAAADVDAFLADCRRRDLLSS